MVFAFTFDNGIRVRVNMVPICEVYSIHKNVVTVCHFPRDTTASSTNKTYCQDITEILLKLELNTITHNVPYLDVWVFPRSDMQTSNH